MVISSLSKFIAASTAITVIVLPASATETIGEQLKPLVALQPVDNSNKSFWRQLPGSAIDVADGWVIGTGANPIGGGYNIYRWNGTSWQEMPGYAVRIGGTYNNPYVVNNENEIYWWDGFAWQQLPGTATDVADGWIIGTEANPIGGGYNIYRWNGTSWQETPGHAVHIGGNASNPYVVNNESEIYQAQ
ncbi:hypothetical protein IQ260_11035 [Leptolyngbya cf. ectocarpi LEGE 11479]|uniref:Uncharacterized protein n=1 Tax=Leptolyngbya cf. ectocarpi LEGE 11479 TaxID=1828722 RepID=A0A928X3G4_LEPEC|nr:hypothetical protein [Leptolyngbya ectocarpi]MBE9067190.1 hypothetical protein [Leptolyngbya cf. ectocarpi LEGE 11479]